MTRTPRNLIFSLLALLLLTAAGASAQPAPRGYLQTDIRDLVLIYQGGAHRMDYTVDQLRPYVVHENRFGRRDWLFDGFLFLEFTSGKEVSFLKQNGTVPSKKEDWVWLADRHFAAGKGISALDECIAQEQAKLGAPPFRHKVVIAIPEPPFGQKDWGELNGRKLDFSNEEDRVAACKWYVDLLSDHFRQMDYKHLELSGFYWLSEKALESRPVTQALGEYIHRQNRLFYWIPYYTAQGYSEWNEMGFDVAYLQPTYFWDNPRIKADRVDRACELARTHHMGLEMEFDMSASVKSKKQLRDRGLQYLSSFRKNGVYRSAAIAYYEGGGGVYHFSKATEPEDRVFIDTLAGFIQQRRLWLAEGQDSGFREDFGQKIPDSRKWNLRSGKPGSVVIKKNRLLLRGNACVDTRGKVDLMYGRIEVRARLLSDAEGVKAKIRMMPATEKLGAWPNSGDMFLMDYDGSRPGQVACGANTMQMNEVNLHNIKQSVLPVENLCKMPHTFTCKWTERDITFLVDGVTANIQEDLFDNRFSYYPQGWPFNCDRFYLEISTESADNSPVLEVEFVEVLPD